MPGFSLNDMEEFLDPALEQDALLTLCLFEESGILDSYKFQRYMLGNKWSKAKAQRIMLYLIQQGYAFDDGNIRISPKGKDKIGKNK